MLIVYYANIALERAYPRDLDDLGAHLHRPHLRRLVEHYLWQQLHPNEPSTPRGQDLPTIFGKIDVFHSAVAEYYAPSDLGGLGGMVRERVRSHPNWRQSGPRCDTVFLCKPASASAEEPMHGLGVGRVQLFFSFHHNDIRYDCVCIHVYSLIGSAPDEDTGLWAVRPQYEGSTPLLRVVSLRTLVRGAHLMPVYGGALLSDDFEFYWTLDAFQSFFVNSYADHHIHQLLSY
jgi:hypothetical protein